MTRNAMFKFGGRDVRAPQQILRRGKRRRVQQPTRSRQLFLEPLETRWVLSEILPTFAKEFVPDTIGPGSVSTLTFTIDNPNTHTETDLAFTDTLPAGVTIASPANASFDCGDGTLTAPDGGGTITFTDGGVAALGSCTVNVDVTSATPGVHMNVSGDLTSLAGNSGPAADDLTVATDRPGFTKIFLPSSVNLGTRSALVFTIDNSANDSAAIELDFTDNLPIGLIIADPAFAVTDCGSAVIPPTLTAVPGTSVITLDANGTGGFPALAAGATCTVEVDVVSTGSGVLGNTSGELLATFGASSLSSGKASAVLDVTVETIHLKKEFLADPVPAGATVDVEFTITNFDRDFPATSVAFTDDLDAALTGLVATGLPIAACGGTLSGTDTITLTGATIAASDSCMFTVTLQVPPGVTPAPYLNTTSDITGDIDGIGVVGAPAEDLLFVEPVPLLTKEFLEAGTFNPDPIVNAGDDVVIRFSVTNTSTTSGASDVAFVDDISSFFPLGGSSVLPTDPCGSGSSIVIIDGGFDNALLMLSNGTLDEVGMMDDSCTFDVTLTLPSDLAPGIYTNTTEEVTATVDGATRTGKPASDDLTVIAAPSLTKEFTDDPVAPGGTVTLEFTLELSPDSPTSATDITFTDDLAALSPAIAGLTANLPVLPDPPCGAGSSLTGSAGDTLLTFMGGSLMPGESCTFSVTLDVPAGAASGSYTNTTSDVSATVGGVAATSGSVSDDLDVTGLVFSKEFLTNPVIAGDTTTLRFTVDNVHPTDDATITFFTDNLQAELTGLAATGGPSVDTCGGSLSGTTFLVYTGGSVSSETSCTIEVEVLVPLAAADGTYANVTSSLVADQGGAVTIDPAIDSLTVNSTLLQLTKEFTDDPVNPGGSVTLELTLINLDASQAASMIDFSDDFGAVLSGVTFDSEDFNDCGATVGGLGTGSLSVTGASLGAGGTCTIRTSLTVPGGAAANVYTNTTSAVTGDIGGFSVSGDAASDELEVVDLLVFSKSFDGPTTATGTAIVTFTITNPTASTATGLSFSDDLDGVISGLVATDVLIDVPPCGVGSTLSGAGTGFLTLTGGELPPTGGTCSFSAEVTVPGTATAGTFPNTTSQLFQSGVPVADPATADLVIEPPPTFAKSFAPDAIKAGEVSTLTFTIDNSASAVAADNLFFIDNFPASVVIADPTNASTTCTGGMGDAAPGATSFSFAGGSVAAGGSCTVEFDVTSSIAGIFVNTTGDLTSSSGNSGTATDTLAACSTHVSSTSDSGNGSLRAAIDCANMSAGVDTIDFDIPGPGPHTIQPLSPLPSITDAVIIDGTTEPDFAGTPVIELDGSAAGAGANGLRITSGGSTVRGLAINRFDNSGVELRNNSGNTIEGSYIGVGTDGASDQGNGQHGVFLVNSTGNTIGGTTAGAGNVISGNDRNGVFISGSSTVNNVVQGNRIGTNADGSAAVPNSKYGIELSSTNSNTIGGSVAGAGNLISGNTEFGVILRQTTSPGNVVRGNLIGTDAAGTADLGNGRTGVYISNSVDNTIGGTTAGARNVISGNDEHGVFIGNPTSTGNMVQGNFIGLDSGGDAALGNTLSGVRIQRSPGNTVGGHSVVRRNVISGNGQDGVHIFGGSSQNNLVAANLIGTDVAGTSGRGNAGHGVQILVGRNNTIGGTAPGQRNVISGNNMNGILISDAQGFSNVVQGNFIGTGVGGNSGLGNGLHGVQIASSINNTIGGTAAGAGNVISGNAQEGVLLGTGTGNLVQGNTIGGKFSLAGGLGNGQSGVRIQSAPGNTIGGAAAGAGNVIQDNGNRGVVVKGDTSIGNRISRNALSLNVGPGIDLIGDGNTPNDVNDPDVGPNNLQNFPVLQTAVLAGGGNLDITYAVPSIAPNSTFPLTVEFFLADSEGREGQTFLGSAVYIQGTTPTDTVPSGAAVAGNKIVATAIDANGNTAEFSANVTVIGLIGLRAEGGRRTPSPGAEVSKLDAAQLQPIVDVALARFASAGVGQQQLDALSRVQVTIADLPGGLLGSASGGTITLDANAAGYGWYVGAESIDKSHEPKDSDSISQLSTHDSQTHMDLLTAVMHELGHELGLEDLAPASHPDDLMSSTLAAGVRRGIDAVAVDRILGDGTVSAGH